MSLRHRTNMDAEFRSMTDTEKELLERLLDVDFPQRDELREQLASLLVKTVDRDGSLALSPSGIPAGRPSHASREDGSAHARLAQQLPIEGRYLDADGIPVCVMLHVADGRLYRLEIMRADGSLVKDRPTAAKLVLGHPSAGGVISPGSLWPSGDADR